MEMELSEGSFQLQIVFARLKAFSIHLLDLLQNPKTKRGESKASTSTSTSFDRSFDRSLSEMASFLRSTPAPALQSCFQFALFPLLILPYLNFHFINFLSLLSIQFYSYTLFPLLLLLDAAVTCRNAKIGDLQVSDGIAEGVLLCIQALLTKCHLTSVNQVLII